MSQSKGLYHRWEYRDTPKGKGVFAIKDFKAGEEVSSKPPILISKHTSDPIEILLAMRKSESKARDAFNMLPYIPSAAEVEEAETMINESKFPETAKKEALAYSNVKQAADRVAKFFHYRVKTPSLPTAGEITCINVISRFGSRLNHSCLPNCWVSWDEAKGVLSTHAIRNIKADEELLIFYDVGELFFKKREARMQELRSEYEFECACPACDLNRGSNAAQRREDLANVMERIQTLLAVNDETPLDPMYRQALTLMDSTQDGWEKGKM
jgi:hypothetical protein